MKPSLLVVTSDEHALWQTFVDAKAKAERTGSFVDAVEAKRRLQDFFCFNNSIIQQNLGVV